MRPILVPFVFSIFLFFAVSPIIEWLRFRVKMNRWLAVCIGFLILMIIFMTIFLFLGMSINTLIKSSSVYQFKLFKFLDDVMIFLTNHGYKGDLNIIRQALRELPILNWVKSFSGGIVGLVGNLILVFIFTFFLLIGKETEGAHSVINKEVQHRISRYIGTKLFTSFLTAFLVWIVFVALKAPMAVMFALFAFVLNFIPNVGSILAVIIPLPVVYLEFGYSVTFILSIIIPGIIQFGIGNILDPKLMGENLGLHPVVVLLSLLFWGFIWGIPGMFLSVPMTAVIKLLFKQSLWTMPLAFALEGKFKAKP